MAEFFHMSLLVAARVVVLKVYKTDTLQGINISHLGKRKIIFKMPFFGDMLVPWRVYICKGIFGY